MEIKNEKIEKIVKIVKIKKICFIFYLIRFDLISEEEDSVVFRQYTILDA